MNGKLILSGIVAGIAMFVWGAISHMGLHICDAYIKSLPNDEQIVNNMRSSIKEPGFYMFPAMEEEKPGMTKEAKEASFKTWSEKYSSGPAGIVVYTPKGGDVMSPKQLGTQLAIDVICGLLAAFLLVKAISFLPSFFAKVAFVSAIGLLAGIAILMPYWNWYGFPQNFVLGSILDQVLAFTCAGIVLALMIKPTTVGTGSSK